MSGTKGVPAIIYQQDDGKWRIKTATLRPNEWVTWIDEFDDEEEATTYALRNGARVEGC